MSTTSPSPGLLKQPAQERSRRAVQRLLDAAEALFAEQGFELATVRNIADAAGVPTGTLYQFFANKEGLLEALRADYDAAVDEIFASVSEEAIAPAIAGGATPLEAMVGYVVGGVIDLAARRPAFRTLFAGSAAAGPLADAGAVLRSRARDQIVLALVLGNPDGSSTYDVAADVCIEVVRGLLPRIVDQRGAVDRALVPELETVLTAYLSEVKARTG